MLFRLSAYAEAGGWTLLLLGMFLKQFVLHGNNGPVLIAGQLHGMLFLGYMLAALGLYPNLRWSRGRAFVALLASVPPYGSLLFEQWAAHQRRTSELRVYRRVWLLTLLTRQPAILQR